MSKEEFQKALKNGLPYFGPYRACRKSWPHIYWFQQKLCKFAEVTGNFDQLSILEIGSWAGASTFSWCSAIARFFEGKGRITCVDIWSENDNFGDQGGNANELPIQKIFEHNISAGGFSNIVNAIKSSSDDAFDKLKDTSFNIVYIDGHHSFSQVFRDLQNGIELLQVGGILCGDDLEIQASEIDPHALEELSKGGREWALDSRSGDGFHPGVTRAVSEVIGPVSVWGGFWAVMKEPDGWRQLNLDEVEAVIPRPLMQYNNDGIKEFDL